MDDFNEGSMEMLLSYDNFVSFNTSEYPLISQSLINEMEKIFKQCKMLMNVSDEELTAFTKEQDRLQKAVEDSTFTAKEQLYLRDYSERNQRLKEAIEQGKKKR